MVTAKECLQSAEVCLALAHKTKELDTRAALLEFAYEFRTVAKRLECDERKLMVRAASPIGERCDVSTVADSAAGLGFADGRCHDDRILSAVFTVAKAGTTRHLSGTSWPAVPQRPHRTVLFSLVKLSCVQD
jgi:hypothetical protein